MISPGEVAERLNAPVLKTGVSERAPWVRIPPSPLGLAMQSDAMCGRNPRFYRGFLRFYRVARETNPGFRQCNLMQTHHHLMSGEWHQFWHLSAPLWAPFCGHLFQLLPGFQPGKHSFLLTVLRGEMPELKPDRKP